jgi:hypothetical protein
MGRRQHVRTGEYTFFYGKGNENHQLEQDFLYTIEERQQLRE